MSDRAPEQPTNQPAGQVDAAQWTDSAAFAARLKQSIQTDTERQFAGVKEQSLTDATLLEAALRIRIRLADEIDACVLTKYRNAYDADLLSSLAKIEKPGTTKSAGEFAPLDYIHLDSQ